MAHSQNEIKAMLPDITPHLFAKPNVVATGIGYKTVNGKKTGDLCIICSVETKVATATLSERDLIPPFLGDIPTDVNPSGIIHPLSTPRERFRPAPGGVSIGHINITAGTLGCLVKKGEKLFILSNNHVLANSNKSSRGDIIVQPAPEDGGISPGDQLARLSDYVPIRFEEDTERYFITRALTGIYNFLARVTGSGMRLYSRDTRAMTNLVDCAIAEPFSEGDVVNEILGAGAITGTAEGILDMRVKKSGRTTGLTEGTIEQTDVTVKVNFGAGKTALFSDQLIAGSMSQGGDSGSVILTNDNDVVGLLFAGSTTTTIINRIQNVFDLLDLTLP